MMTKKHSDYCWRCKQNVDCEAARTGGCPFPRSDCTCGPCAVLSLGGTEEQAAVYRHLCECPAPDPPIDGAVCGICGRWVDLAYGEDRVFDLPRLGQVPKRG